MSAATALVLVARLATSYHEVAKPDLRVSSGLRDKPWLMQSDVAAPRTIEKGDLSNIDDAKQVVVRTPAEWAALWRQHAPERPMPSIDFSKETVVGVFMGGKPTAGFSIAVISVVDANGVLIVSYRETLPARDAVTAQLLTFPYHLVAIPKSTATNVKFERMPNP